MTKRKTVDLGCAVLDGVETKHPVVLDPMMVVKHRMVINANSGAGKSYTFRRILELTHGWYPHHVFDPEGEFHTLREKFDYVLAGKPGGQKGDCPAEPKMARQLARKMLELRTSVVIDLCDLDPRDRELFAREYIDEMMQAPRIYWRPTLVAIDEAPMFCPEKDEGQALSTDAVIALMSRGRKRGYGGLLATQRISAVRKRALAECNNVLIGRTALDLDLDRAGKALGYNRNAREVLKRLPPGRFHGYGPAIATEVTVVQIGEVTTTHPESGEAAPPPPAARGKIAKVMEELTSLPAEAEAEAKTAAEMKAKIKELEARVKRQIPVNMTTPGIPSPTQLERAVTSGRVEGYDRGYHDGYLKAKEHATDWALSAIQKAADAVDGASAKLQSTIKSGLATARDAIAKGDGRSPRKPKMDANVHSRANDHAKPSNGAHLPPNTESRTITAPTGDGGKLQVEEISGPGKKLLDALAWFEAIGISDPDATAAAFVAGYSPTSGTFANVKGACRSQGLITYPASGKLSLTDTGRAAATSPDIPMTNEGLQEAILAKLDGAGEKLLRALLPHGSEGLSSEELAEATGYSGRSGTFANVKGKLRSLGLVVYPKSGQIAASIVMYPEG